MSGSFWEEDAVPVPSDASSFWDDDAVPTHEVTAAPAAEDDEKAKLRKRVGPPTPGDMAVMRDIPALTGLGYAASEVPVAGPVMQRLIRKVSPEEAEKIELGKARYEQENPRGSTALQFAAPLALPFGPAKLGAQAIYQGATSAADTIARGGSMDDAEASGALTTGASLAMGKAGRVVAPYLKRAGGVVDSVSGRVRDILKKRAAEHAAEAALSGQKRLNSSLSEAGKRGVGEALMESGVMDSSMPKWVSMFGIPSAGQTAATMVPKVKAAEAAANGEITKLINDLTEKGINPTKQQVLARIEALKAGVERTPDTEPFHAYLDRQAEYIASVPDERFSLRFIQNLKNNVPFDKLADSTLSKGRKGYKGALQETQDQVIEGTGAKDAYKALQGRASGLINAAKGVKERAAREAANRRPGLTDYLTGGAGLVAGSVLGSQYGDSLGGGAAGGLAVGALLGGANRLARTRGSSAMAANLGRLGKMFDTKFGPMLEQAAMRGKGALSVAHRLLYDRNPEYRILYDKDPEAPQPENLMTEK